MRKKILYLLLLVFVSLHSVAQVRPDYLGYTHPKITAAMVKNPKYIDNVSQFPSNYKGNDTFIVRIPVINGGLDFGADSGLDWNHPIVFINGVDQVIINGGIRNANVQNFSLLGWGSDSTYGFKMVGGGTGGTWDGMQKNNRIISCDFTGASQGGVWIKQDPNNVCQFYTYNSQFPPTDPRYKYADPYQYLYAGNKPYDSIWFIHNRVRNCGGEGIYFGSTDYIMSNGQWERQVPCLNNARLAPTQLQNCRADSNDVNTTGRTGIQMSQASAGINSISYNHIQNNGYEYPAIVSNPPYNPNDSIGSLSQGAKVRVGWSWNQQAGRQMNVVGNFGDTSLIYFLDIEEAANVQSNNFGKNFGKVYYNNKMYTNPQQNPSGFFQAKNKATSIQQICNNNLLSTTGGGGTITFALYNSANYLATGNHGNGNNTPISYFGTGGAFDTNCGALPPLDTGCVNRDTTYYVDSYVTGHFDTTFGYRDTTFRRLKNISARFKNRNYIVKYTYDSSLIDSTIKYIIRLPYDSIYICAKCRRVDTTICVPRTKTVGYGVFILNGYNGLTTNPQKLNYTKRTLKLKYMRENYTVGNGYINQMFLDSAITPLMTYNTADVSSGPNPFPIDLVQMQKTADSLFKISKPTLAAYENEPTTLSYWDSSNNAAQKYVNGLNAFISVCHANGVLACDGGSTFVLVYNLANYYQRTGKTDSLNWLSNVTGISTNTFFNSQNGKYWNSFYATLLPAIKNSQADYAQLHYYAPPRQNQTDSTTDNGLLTVLLNYLSTNTGKKIISLETGTGNYSQLLFNDMFTEWAKYQPDYICYFLGTGSVAVPNESYYLNFVANNP